MFDKLANTIAVHCSNLKIHKNITMIFRIQHTKRTKYSSWVAKKQKIYNWRLATKKYSNIDHNLKIDSLSACENVKTYNLIFEY